MHSQNALAVAFDSSHQPGLVQVPGRNAREIQPLLTAGTRLEIKYANPTGCDDLNELMNLRRAGAIKFDELTVRYVTAVYTERDRNRRSNRPIVFEITKEFGIWQSNQSNFFDKLAPKLQHIKILPF